MAGHSQFANIKHRKGAQDAKRAKIFTKLIRRNHSCCKTGQSDPEFNPRLRNVLIEARSKNLQKTELMRQLKSNFWPRW